MSKSAYKRDADGFIQLELLPGVSIGKHGKLRKKLPKTPEKLNTEIAGQYGEEYINIGDYIMETGIIHALNMNIGRHLPWIEDGLKSVERRILYSMYRMGLNKSKMAKIASISGEMLKTVHPHGDAAISDTIYRIGRKFTMMVPYVDGHGSFGNMSTMIPAADRYAEARLSAYAIDCFFSEMDLIWPIYDEKETYNYDSLEPVFLPSKYPNTLIQYNLGIGKGASTNLVAFNTKDIFKVAIQMLDDPDCPVNIYPDTPIPLDIINKSELNGCFDKTSFKVRMRGRYRTYVTKKLTDQRKLVDKYCIEFDHCPMNTYGQMIIDTITRLKKADESRGDKRFPEIINVECAGTEEELHLVVEYEKGYDPNVLAEKLYKSTPLEMVYGANYTLVSGNKPERYTPRDLMKIWIEQRLDQKRRYYYQKALMAAKDKARYDAYVIVLDPKNVDDATAIIRKSSTDEETVEKLKARFHFNGFQALAVMDLKLKSLNRINANTIREKSKEAEKLYWFCREMLSDSDNIKNAIREELEDGLKKYGRSRVAKVFNMKTSNEDPDAEKILVYNHSVYFCLENYDGLCQIANKIDKSFNIIKITNGTSVLIFGDKGILKILDGYAFSYTTDGISMENMAFPGVVKIMKNDPKSDNIALITKNGYGKVMEFKECTKSVKGRVITLNNGDLLAAVIHVREGGIVGMINNDKLYYVRLESIPLLKRTSAGNRLVKGVEDLCITSAMYTDESTPYIFLYGESGYAKILDTQYLGFSKRGNNCISFQNKAIYGVVSVSKEKHADLILYDAEGKLPIKIDIGDKISLLANGMKTPATFTRSTTIGSPIKIFKKGKYEFYRIQ